MSDVVVTKESYGAKVTMARPPVNAVSTEMAIELEAAFDKLIGEQPAIVVLASSTPHFCAGADMKEVHPDAAHALRRMNHIGSVQRKMREVPYPMIAAINGSALGLGYVLGTLCDIRVAKDDAKIGLPEVKRGRSGGLSAVRPLVSEGWARLLAYQGDALDAAEALRIGLVEKVYSSDTWDKSVEELAQSIADNGKEALYMIKESVKRTATMGPELGLWSEQQIAYRLWTEGTQHVWK